MKVAPWQAFAAAAVDGSLAITLPTALAMSTSAANACQGATFTVYLVAA